MQPATVTILNWLCHKAVNHLQARALICCPLNRLWVKHFKTNRPKYSKSRTMLFHKALIEAYILGKSSIAELQMFCAELCICGYYHWAVLVVSICNSSSGVKLLIILASQLCWCVQHVFKLSHRNVQTYVAWKDLMSVISVLSLERSVYYCKSHVHTIIRLSLNIFLKMCDVVHRLQLGRAVRCIYTRVQFSYAIQTSVTCLRLEVS